MQILANENVSGEVVEALRGLGHDVAWVRTDAPGSSDPQVLERAQLESRVLVTFDKDFGELAFRYRLPAHSGIILLRVRASSPELAVSKVVAVLESREDWQGQFSVVEEDHIRMTPL